MPCSIRWGQRDNDHIHSEHIIYRYFFSNFVFTALFRTARGVVALAPSVLIVMSVSSAH